MYAFRVHTGVVDIQSDLHRLNAMLVQYRSTAGAVQISGVPENSVPCMSLNSKWSSCKISTGWHRRELEDMFLEIVIEEIAIQLGISFLCLQVTEVPYWLKILNAWTARMTTRLVVPNVWL